jgi:B-box zinc finger
MCQLTDKKQVLAVCSYVECEENLCADHQEDHALRKVTSSHAVILIKVPPRQYPAPVKCAYHLGRDIDGFCDTCNIFMCGLCCLEDHRGHKHRIIAEVDIKVRAIVDTADDAQATLDVTTMRKNKMQLGEQRLGVEFHQCEVERMLSQLRWPTTATPHSCSSTATLPRVSLL